MLSVADALRLIDDAIRPLNSVDVPIAQALGCRLAGDVTSDVDSPPFDKSLMDGFAVSSADAQSRREFEVVAILYAGSVSSITLGAGQAMQIMTGAPLPRGADCVVRREDAALDESARRVRLNVTPRAGQDIILKGASMKAGEQIMRQGFRLTAAAVGVFAELGRSRISVARRPECSILATGDELVDITVTPVPGQIRNSNESMLHACATNAGGLARPLGVCPDDAEKLDRFIAEGLQSDILCLSGGVSAGDKDLVPAALQRAGARQVFHKVNLKPGKPIWFGVHEAHGKQCCIFGLPGNPVSSLVCFELFVRHAMERLQGAVADWRMAISARLTQRVRLQAERPVYHPARLVRKETLDQVGNQVEILNWQGSSDLRGVAAAEGVVHIPAGEGVWEAGQVVEFLRFGAAH